MRIYSLMIIGTRILLLSVVLQMNITDDCYVVSQLHTVPGPILYLGVKFAMLNCEYNSRVNIIVGDGKNLQLMFNFQFFPPVIQQLIEILKCLKLLTLNCLDSLKSKVSYFLLIKCITWVFFRPKIKCFNQSSHYDKGWVSFLIECKTRKIISIQYGYLISWTKSLTLIFFLINYGFLIRFFFSEVVKREI